MIHSQLLRIILYSEIMKVKPLVANFLKQLSLLQLLYALSWTSNIWLPMFGQIEIWRFPLNPGQTVLLSDNDVNDISIQRGCIFLHVICQLLFFILLEVWALYGAKKIIFMLHLVSHGYPKIQSISLHCCHVLFCNSKMLWHFFMGGLWTSFLA